MKTRLIIDGNAVYEIDEECEACMKKKGDLNGRKFRQETVRNQTEPNEMRRAGRQK